MIKSSFTYSSEVQKGILENCAIVALESSIISHGMPSPKNVETAIEVENIIKNEGAIPATIAVIEGKINVGLEKDLLQFLAKSTDSLKLSRSNLAYAVATKKTGSTTVAATMMVAHQAGIRIFATGGIGGVHKGAETSFDISADLNELAITPVCVVSAGAKAILDLPKSLELLESKGVPIIGYKTNEFPAFWSESSSIKIPLRLESPDEIANFLNTRDLLGNHGGELIANPIPKPSEIPFSDIERYVQMAIEEAAVQKIQGSALTPYILKEITNYTNGRSLESNIALVKNNAKLAAKIAISWQKLKRAP